MNTSSTARIIAALSLVAAIGACTPSGMGQGSLLSVVFESRRPPADRVEYVPARPERQDVWVGGHWAPNGNNYAWQQGSWQRPQQGKKEWVKGDWKHESRGWHYTDGHWR